MSKLLKEAIADAGLVRETALANAKLALEEAFTPTIQSMLSKKIQSEVEGEEDEVAVEDEEAGEEEVGGEEGGSDVPAELDIPADETEEIPAEDAEVADDEIAVEDEGEVEVEDDDDDDDDESEELDDEYEEGGEDLDLEAILRELEDGVEDEEEVTENDGGEVESGVSDEDEVSETINVNGQTYALVKEEEDEDGEEVTESEDGMEGESEKLDDLKEEDGEGEEELDLESVLKALSEDDDEEEVTESEDGMEGESEKLDDLKESLKEHQDVIRKLRTELNEINLLNAKLLFTNKLFKSFDLDNSGKLRVVEMFDRTKNLREIKLVYATLQESFKNGKVQKISKITEGLASKPVASTKSSKEVVSDGDAFANRLKKLAGIK